jgi:hypothetical protein
MTEREKAQQIEKVMRKGAAAGAKRKEIKVVVAKGAHKGVKGRPKGVKGRYQMVDARMRKEVSVSCSYLHAFSERRTASREEAGRKGKQKAETNVTIMLATVPSLPFVCVNIHSSSPVRGFRSIKAK